jgi:hypothetical protein
MINNVLTKLTIIRCSFKFLLKVGVEESIVNVLSRAKNFGRQCHFKVWLDCHKLKIFPA